MNDLLLRRLFAGPIAALLMLTPQAATAAAPKPAPLVERARTVLLADLAREKAFVKVHAAEALIALGHKDEARHVFQAELPAADDSRPYRIGVWRVLAAASSSPRDRAEWIARTEKVVLDETTMDRLHAVESLGKLGHAPSGPVKAAIEEMAKGPLAGAIFPRWVLHLAGDATALPAIIAALDSDDAVARLRAAYVLQWLKIGTAPARAALDRAAEREPTDSVGYGIVIGAAVMLDANPARTPGRVAVLEKILAEGATGARYQACLTLMRRYTNADLPKLVPLLDHPEGDARIGAAWAILHIASAAK